MPKNQTQMTLIILYLFFWSYLREQGKRNIFFKCHYFLLVSHYSIYKKGADSQVLSAVLYEVNLIFVSDYEDHQQVYSLTKYFSLVIVFANEDHQLTYSLTNVLSLASLFANMVDQQVHSQTIFFRAPINSLICECSYKWSSLADAFAY